MVETVEIVYESARVQRYFLDYEMTARRIGRELARNLKKRMNQIEAAETFQDYLMLRLGNPHSLDGDLYGSYSVALSGNIRLILTPQCSSLDPASLNQCKYVAVKGVCDYHGSKTQWIIP